MKREEIVNEFYMEDHAVLYALLAKEAITTYGKEGEEATVKGTILYAKERGLRMAMRALADGEELTLKNYLVYKEWDDYKKVSKSKVASLTPEYRTNNLICGWCDAWKKHNLLEYGKIYCVWIDKNLVKGFNPENTLEIDSLLSHGEDCCDFHWLGTNFNSEEELKKNNEKKVTLSKRTLKDFLYHTGHLLSAMTRQYYMDLGLIKGQELIKKALNEYEIKFGKMKREAIEEEAKLDFLVV